MSVSTITTGIKALATGIKKYGYGPIVLAVFLVLFVYTFTKFVPDIQGEIRGVSADIKQTLVTVTKEFRAELREQRVEAAQERAMMWQMVNQSRVTQAEPDNDSTPN